VQTVFDALAEPNRRAILGLLAEHERSVGELEDRLELPQPLISKHLRVLRDTGFVEARTEAQLRVYRLKPEPLIALDKWLEPYRRYWHARFDALERHLDRMPGSTRTKKAKKSKKKGRAR
jgi:DNA-binding transcriptional ArsR family regulator